MLQNDVDLNETTPSDYFNGIRKINSCINDQTYQL